MQERGDAPSFLSGRGAGGKAAVCGPCMFRTFFLQSLKVRMDSNHLSPVEGGLRPHPRLRKGIYILPNLFTLAALFGGFYSIVMAMNGRFDLATIGVFCAMVLDSLDGRVARLTHTQSAFGEQMDSLADMVSFGAAPALIAYEWALRPIGRWGWIAAFVYCACAALRLARFNVNTGVVDKRYFQGLPSPAAAALVTGFIWLTNEMIGAHREVPWFKAFIELFTGSGIVRGDLSWFMFALTLFGGLTMVTNIPYYSFKDFGGRRSVPFTLIVALVLVIAVINIEPPTMLFAFFVCYALSGYIVYAWRKSRGEAVSIVSTSTSEPDEQGLHK